MAQVITDNFLKCGIQTECDGGRSCRQDNTPDEKTCKKCLCSSCLRGRCQGKPMSLVCSGDKVDLSIERDAGNPVLILMGKPEYALVNWKNLQSLCNQAVKALEETVKRRA